MSQIRKVPLASGFTYIAFRLVSEWLAEAIILNAQTRYVLLNTPEVVQKRAGFRLSAFRTLALNFMAEAQNRGSVHTKCTGDFIVRDAVFDHFGYLGALSAIELILDAASIGHGQHLFMNSVG
jgi:hypothetical protein